jgi:hypothetical protein
LERGLKHGLNASALHNSSIVDSRDGEIVVLAIEYFPKNGRRATPVRKRLR